MRRLFLLTCTALMVCGAAHSQSKADLNDVKDTSTVDQTGARLLQDTVRIHASAAVVWKALTDEATYRKWAAPTSFIDFRVGGLLEVGFQADAKKGDPSNLKQQITAYVPEKLLVFRNLPSSAGPPGSKVYPELAIVMQITRLPGGDTEVSLSQVGYRQGQDFDQLYTFFKTHNPEYLMSLKTFAEH